MISDGKNTGIFFRYLISGSIVTIVGTLAMTVAVLLMPYPLAYTLVFVASMLANLFLHSTFVFRRRLDNKSGPRAIMALLFQYAFGLGCLAVIIDMLKVSPVYAPALSLGIIVPVNFFTSRLAFNQSPEKM